MGTGYAKKKKEAKMREQQFLEFENSLLEQRFTGQAGNGLVSVVLNGKSDMVSINIKPECLDSEDPEAVEDLIKSAHQNAKESMDAEMDAMKSNFFAG